MSSDEKAAARAAERERRMARIKAGSSNRLAKITGSAGTKDFKPPVAAPRTAAASPGPSTAPALSPAPADVYADPDVVSGDRLLNFLAQSREHPLQAQAQPDPLLAFLAQQGAGPGSPLPPSPGGAQQTQAATQAKLRARAELAWDGVHFVSSVLIGLYAALANPWNMWVMFGALEAVLLGGKALLGHQAGVSSTSWIAPFVGMLPKARQRQVSFAGSLFMAGRSAYRDFAVILFMYGFVGLGSPHYERPV